MSGGYHTIVYFINRGPCTPLGYGILEEAWTSKNVSYSFLKTFHCETFAHIDSKNRTELEAKSKKCVFLGYGINEFGYRLWDFENKKMVRSRMSYLMRKCYTKICCSNMRIKKMIM